MNTELIGAIAELDSLSVAAADDLTSDGVGEGVIRELEVASVKVVLCRERKLELTDSDGEAIAEILADESVSENRGILAAELSVVRVSQVVRELVVPARVNHVAAKGEAGALVLEAVGLSGGRRVGAVLAVVEGPADLLEDIDLHRVVAVRRRQEEATVVARTSGSALEARTGFRVREDISDDAADLGSALLGEPLTVLGALEGGDLGLELCDLRERVIVLLGSESRATDGEGRDGNEADGLGETHVRNSPYLYGREKPGLRHPPVRLALDHQRPQPNGSPTSADSGRNDEREVTGFEGFRLVDEGLRRASQRLYCRA